MKLSLARLMPLMLVLALALISLWLERAVNRETTHPSTRRHDPDYIVSRFTLTAFDASGHAESSVAAEQMSHFPDNNTTEIIGPRVVRSRTNRPEITVSARRGVMSHDGGDIFLYDDVKLVKSAGAGYPQGTIETSYMYFDRARSFASTDRAVRFHEPGRTLSGRGMEYDGALHRFVLKNEVRGSFDKGKNRS